jgi:hypothetical protein
MKLGAVLVPIPTPLLPFIAHLLANITRKVTLEAGCVDTNKLALAIKICMLTTLQCPFLGAKCISLWESSKAIHSNCNTMALSWWNVLLRLFKQEPFTHSAQTFGLSHTRCAASLHGTMHAKLQYM